MSISTSQGTAAPTAPPGAGALERVLGPVDELLGSFLVDRVADLADLDKALVPVGNAVADLVRAGGKRLRPAFVYWGHRATGAPHTDAVLWPAAAVELLHTFALIHDDVMDRSDERRGLPAVHTALGAVHGDENLVGDPAWFGTGGAILAGDLAFVWADQLLDAADLAPRALDEARRVFTTLRVEVMAGQYLDLRLAGTGDATESDALRVALLKSGRYTVTRPLQLGAAIAGSDRDLDATLAAYGDAVGLAFQLRDDVLGLFGDPDVTGKGSLEDLREGKRTVLMLRALELADAADRETLRGILGDPDLAEPAADRARSIVIASGALGAVEDLMKAQRALAGRAVEHLADPARGALLELADLASIRDA